MSPSAQFGVPLPPSCPICRSDSGYRDPRVPMGEGSILICQACKGFFLHPRMHVDYSDSRWSRGRELSWQTDVDRGRHYAPLICRDARRHLGRPLQSVLEIGCGSAFMAPGFAAAGCEYHGLDVDPKVVEFARRNGITAHQVSAEDMHSSPLSRRTYDLVLSSNVFEHVQDPLAVFANARAVCGGLLAIIVPNPRGLFQQLRAVPAIRKAIQLTLRSTRGYVYTIDGRWTNIGYSRSTLEILCRMTGFEPLYLHTISVNHPTFGFVQPNVSLLYRATSSLAGLLDMHSQLLLIARPTEEGEKKKATEGTRQ